MLEQVEEVPHVDELNGFKKKTKKQNKEIGQAFRLTKKHKKWKLKKWKLL